LGSDATSTVHADMHATISMLTSTIPFPFHLAVRTEVFNNQAFSFIAADPFALTNARMISDMLDKPVKKKEKEKGGARRLTSPGPKRPGVCVCVYVCVCVLFPVAITVQ